MRLVPKNWIEFQHYRNRRPPWIKLHRALLDDSNYMRLPTASRAIAPLLWLLASESDDGEFDGSIEELSFRLRRPEDEIRDGLAPLLDAEFFLDASTMLAACMQHASSEGEERERRGEGEFVATAPALAPPKPSKKKQPPATYPEDFETFWAVYGRRGQKPQAFAQWKKLEPDRELAETIVAAAMEWNARHDGVDEKGQDLRQFQPHPFRWLRDRRWEDDLPPVRTGKATQVGANGRPLVASSKMHTPNMPLGSDDCDDCVAYRASKDR